MKRRLITVLCLLAMLLGMVFVPATKAEAAAGGYLQAGYGKVNVSPDTVPVKVTCDYYDTATGGTVTGGTITIKGITAENALIFGSYGTPQLRMGVTELTVGTYIGDKRIVNNAVPLGQRYQILDGDLYTTCIALKGTNGKLVLLITLDQPNAAEAVTARIRQEVCAALEEKKVQIEPADIIVSASHTHSAPNPDSTDENTANWVNEKFYPGIVEAAIAAVDDLSDVTMEIRRVTAAEEPDLQYMSSVRHYRYEIYQCPSCGRESYTTGTLYNCPASGCHATMKKVEKYYGDSFHTRSQGIQAPTSMQEVAEEAYQDMFLVRFVRRDRTKKDIVLINWRAHPHRTGGDDESVFSADIVGSFRETLAQETGLLVSYYQGAAGNINEISYDRVSNGSNDGVTSTNTYAAGYYGANQTTNFPTNYLTQGQRLAEIAQSSLGKAADVTVETTGTNGQIHSLSSTFTAEGQDLSVQILQLAQKKYAARESGYTAYTGFGASGYAYDFDAIFEVITPEHKQELIQAIYDSAVAMNAAWTQALNNGGDAQDAHQAARDADKTGVLNGRYQANNIVSVLKNYVDSDGNVDYAGFVASPTYHTEELAALTIGNDLAIVTAPHELFDNTSLEIEAIDPSKTILTFGYSNGGNGYLPNKDAWYLVSSTDGAIYSPYEANTCRYKVGTAEQIVAVHDMMLTELAGITESDNHCACGGKTEFFHGDHVCDYSAWKTLEASDETEFLLDGKYALSGDTVVYKLVVEPGCNAMLCLKGHKLTTNYTITVHSGGTLAICDCTGGGVINNVDESARVFEVRAGGKLFLYGGTVTGLVEGSSSTKHRVITSAGNVYMFDGIIENGTTSVAEYGSNVTVQGGNFWLYGGTIQNGITKANGNATETTVHGCGGNVFISGGVFEQRGGTIQNGTAGVSGGNIAMTGGEAYLYGGVIKDGQLADGAATATAKNTPGCGGNIYVGGGHFHQYGGTVQGSTAPVSGGNIYLQDLVNEKTDGSAASNVTTKYTIHTNAADALIDSGTAEGGNGGNVFVSSGCEFTMYDGTISGGHATKADSQNGNGGNIYGEGMLWLYDGRIENGIARWCGGNIYAKATLRVGGEVTGGSAHQRGNNIYMNASNSVLNLTDAVITEPTGIAVENVNVHAAKSVKLIDTQIIGGKQAICIKGTDADAYDETETKKEEHGVWLDGAPVFDGTVADIALDSNSPLCMYDTFDLSQYYYNDGKDMNGASVEDNRIKIMCVEDTLDFQFARKAVAYEKDESGAFIVENGSFVLHNPSLKLSDAKYCFVGSQGESVAVKAATTETDSEEDIRGQWLYFDPFMATVGNGDEKTHTLQGAVSFVANNGGTVKLLQDIDMGDTALTIPKASNPHDVVIDLHGFDLTAKTITNNSTETFACVDLSSVNYENKTHGVLYTNSNVENQYQHSDSGKTRRFLRIPEAANSEGVPGYSFHRVYMNMASVAITPKTTGISYSSVFLADPQVVNVLNQEGNGYGLSFTITLDGKNVTNYETASFVEFDTMFKAGPYDQTSLEPYTTKLTLLENILSGNELKDYTVAERARMNITVKTAVKIGDDIIYPGNSVTRSFKDMVKSANTAWTNGVLDENQPLKDALFEMYSKYSDEMGTWDDEHVSEMRGLFNELASIEVSIDTSPDGAPWE